MARIQKEYDYYVKKAEAWADTGDERLSCSLWIGQYKLAAEKIAYWYIFTLKCLLEWEKELLPSIQKFIYLHIKTLATIIEIIYA